jgi:hypothetical protein
MDKHPADTPERDWPTLHPQDDVDAMRPDRAWSDDGAEPDSAERDGKDDQASDGDSAGSTAAG